MMSIYRSSTTIETRQAESQRLLAKNPGHAAVVIEAKEIGAQLLSLPADATMAELEAAACELLGVVGKKLALSVAGCTPASSSFVGDYYKHCKLRDGFLYVTCSSMGAPVSGEIPCLGSGAYEEDEL